MRSSRETHTRVAMRSLPNRWPARAAADAPQSGRICTRTGPTPAASAPGLRSLLRQMDNCLCTCIGHLQCGVACRSICEGSSGKHSSMRRFGPEPTEPYRFRPTAPWHSIACSLRPCKLPLLTMPFAEPSMGFGVRLKTGVWFGDAHGHTDAAPHCIVAVSTRRARGAAFELRLSV